MGSIGLRDTGKKSVKSVNPTEVMAYGDEGVGTKLSLKGAEASINIKTMVTQDTPPLKRRFNLDYTYFEWGESDMVGVQMPLWSIKGYANRSDENDMIALGRLIAMCQTSGYKELYSADDGVWRDIIAYSKYGINEIEEEPQMKVDFINVRIIDVQITQSADKKGFNYSLNMVETN